MPKWTWVCFPYGQTQNMHMWLDYKIISYKTYVGITTSLVWTKIKLSKLTTKMWYSCGLKHENGTPLEFTRIEMIRYCGELTTNNWVL